MLSLTSKNSDVKQSGKEGSAAFMKKASRSARRPGDLYMEEAVECKVWNGLEAAKTMKNKYKCLKNPQNEFMCFTTK